MHDVDPHCLTCMQMIIVAVADIVTLVAVILLINFFPPSSIFTSSFPQRFLFDKNEIDTEPSLLSVATKMLELRPPLP